MQKKETLTGTGTTDAIKLNPYDQLTFAAVGDQTDYTLTAEVKLTDDGNWITAQSITDSTLYSTVTGAREFRFNLSSLGTATTIDIEVTGAKL